MIENKSVLAIIPARGGSKGLPEKNIREFCGKPLIAWTIEQALASQYVDRVLVTTDSLKIADISLKYGAIVPFIRPKNLATDTATSIDVIVHLIEYEAMCGRTYDYMVLLEPTSPLRDVSDIDGSIEMLVNSKVARSVVGVSKAECSHPAFLFSVEDGLMNPMLDSGTSVLRRQDLTQHYYFLEGSVYVTEISVLLKRRSFYHRQTAPWVVERYKSLEIDELSDFIAAEALMKAKIDGLLS